MLVVILIAIRQLTSDEQGYFFALMSVGALVQIGDFGLSYAVMQKASHLGATASMLERRVRRWSLRTAALSTAAGAIFGTLSIGAAYVATLDLKSLLVVCAALVALFAAQAATPLLALQEGSGRVTQAWRLRLLQEWAGGLVCAAALYCGAGLHSLLFFWMARAAVTLPLLLKNSSTDSRRINVISWREDIWPFQWRIGLSNASGFLIFRASTLVVIAEQGAGAAGRYGLALAAMNMMLAVSAAWPNSAATRLGQLISSGQAMAAIAEARRTRLRSSLFSLVSALTVWGVFALASKQGLEISLRMADQLTLALVLSTGVVHHLVATQAVILRAEFREPLLTISLIGGIANLSGTWIAAHFATMPVVAATTLSCALIGLAVSTHLLAKQLAKWKEAKCALQNT